MTNRDFKFGFILFLGFLSYFFVMKAANLYENFYLRIFNFIIHAGIVYMAVKQFYAENVDKKFNYLTGVAAGLKASVIGVIAFGIFQAIYLNLDTGLMNSLREFAPLGEYLTPLKASVVIVLEGLGVSVPISYVAMRIVDHQEIKAYESRL